MMLLEPSPVIRARIRERLPDMPPHQVPIWRAVLEGCAYAAIVQGDGAFRIPQTRPAILVIGDDLHTSKGPSAFHGRSLRKFLSRCGSVAVISSEATVEAYAPVALASIGLRQDGAIIETQPEHEAEWLDLVNQAAPLARLLVSRPYPAERVH